MHPDACKDLGKYYLDLKSHDAPKKCYPRFFYSGHKVIASISPSGEFWEAEDGTRFLIQNHNAKWQCHFCKHEWIGLDGQICPNCNRKAQ